MVDKLTIGEINSGPFNAIDSLIDRLNTGAGGATQVANIADSIAEDVPGIVADFNALLAAMKAAGIMVADVVAD